MATITPINSWPVPTSTDLVKDGAVAIESLGDAIDASVGSGLLAWQTWAPTLSGGWSNGNGVWSAKYCQIGKTVLVKGYFILGSTTGKGTTLDLSLPVTAADTIGMQSSSYVSVAGTLYSTIISLNSVSAARLYATNTAGTYATFSNITTAIPGAWATSDWIRVQFTYQAA